MELRRVNIELVYKTSNNENITPINEAREVAYKYLENSQFMEDEGLVDYQVWVIDEVI